MKTSKWAREFPLWVSRKDSDGFIYRLSVPVWLALSLFGLALLNAAAWGAIGLIKAAQWVIG